MVVPNTLKPGLDEKLYENALVLELQARAHAIFSYPRKSALFAVKVFVDCSEPAPEHLR